MKLFFRNLFKRPEDPKLLFLEHRTIQLIFKNIPFALTGAFIVITAAFAMFQDQISFTSLKLWYFINISIIFIRMAIRVFFRNKINHFPSALNFYKLYFIFTALSGIALGSSSYLIFPERSILHQFLLVFIAGGLTVTAIGSYGSKISLFSVYSLLGFGPILFRFIYEGNRLHYIGVVFSLVFLAAMFLTGLNYSRTIRSSIFSLFEKNTLTDELNREKSLSDIYLEIAGSIILIIDEKGNFHLANKMGREILGVHSEELSSLNFFKDFIPKNTADQFTSALKKSSSVGNHNESYQFTGILSTRTGVDKTISWTFSTITSKTSIAKYLISGIDVTEEKRSETELRESEKKFKSFFVNNSAPMIIFDYKTGLITDANKSATDFFNISLERLRRKHFKDIFFEYEKVPEANIISEMKFYLQDDEVRIAETHSSSININGRNMLYVILHDITESKLNENKIQLAKSVFDNAHESILVTDENMKIVDVNESFERISGYSREDILGKSPSILKSGKHDKTFFDTMWKDLNKRGYWEGEIWNKKKDGNIFPFLLSVNVVKNSEGKICNYSGILTDITQIKEAEKKLEHLAHYDALTELPNRSLLQITAEHAINKTIRSGKKLGIMFLDLDRFKLINDTMGHDAGDLFLKEVSRRLTDRLRRADAVSRLGGDEFVILLEDLATINDVTIVAKQILKSFHEPFSIKGKQFFSSTSIGISIYPDDGGDFHTLLKHADTALYEAKQNGRANYQFFNNEMNDRARKKLEIEHMLFSAIQEDRLVIHYQAQKNLNTGKITGAEALVRISEKDGKLIYPGNFISIAEETGLIHALFESVMLKSCRDISDWESQGIPCPRISINVSASQFKGTLLKETIHRISQETCVEPRKFEIEITENAVFQNLDQAVEILNDLKQIGFRFALDDFGTGLSPLNYLTKLPVERIKIDKSFIGGIPHNEEEMSIVKSLINLSHSLGKIIIAEGVENTAQLEFLRENGCDEIQGFYFSRPIPAKEFTELLKLNLQKK